MKQDEEEWFYIFDVAGNLFDGIAVCHDRL